MSGPFDSAHFDTMTGADRVLQAEVIGLFRGQAVKLAAALTPNTPVQARRAAIHTLKGSARGIGLWALAEACERAEARGAENDIAALGDVQAALAGALTALNGCAVADTPRG